MENIKKKVVLFLLLSEAATNCGDEIHKNPLINPQLCEI